MSNTPRQRPPFAALGTRLKKLREACKESLAEVSGAVEIDEDTLKRIERGEACPSEDILMLLISHFNIRDEEAIKMMELAGFSSEKLYADPLDMHDSDTHKPIMMVMPMDARIVYTDLVNVTANNHGVVMNFMQTTGMGGQPMAIARVGMSREHAESVLEVLQQTLRQASQPPRQLQAPSDHAAPKDARKDRQADKTDKN